MGKKSRRSRPKTAPPSASGPGVAHHAATTADAKKSSPKSAPPSTSASGPIAIATKRATREVDAAGDDIIDSAAGGLQLNASVWTAPPPAPATIPAGASCWICLEDGPDETGQPIVRSCSCRGDSGFSHVACVIKFLEKKSEEFGQSGRCTTDFLCSWDECANCQQMYFNEFRLNLAYAFFSTVKSIFPCQPRLKSFAFPCHPEVYASALSAMMLAFNRVDQDRFCLEHYDEAKKIGVEMSSLIRTLEAYPARIFRSSYIPTGIKQQEANVNKLLGAFTMRAVVHGLINDTDGAATAINYFEKSRDISNSIGDTDGAQNAELSIARAIPYSNSHPRPDPQKRSSTKEIITNLRNQYKEHPHPQSGIGLLLVLMEENYAIESQRLATKLVRDCRQVQGAGHECTKQVEAYLNQASSRYVKLISLGCRDFFEALRYDGENKCVVKGPKEKVVRVTIAPDQENAQEEKIFLTHSSNMILMLGTPVVCCGLKKASHLNGKIGDVRNIGGSVKDMSIRYEVHFDDSNLKPCLVKPSNVRILFDIGA